MTKREVMQQALAALINERNFREDNDCVSCGETEEAIARLRTELSKPEPEPVAWMFHHDETGRIVCVDSWQVENGFENLNPRLQKICPLYRKEDV